MIQQYDYEKAEEKSLYLLAKEGSKVLLRPFQFSYDWIVSKLFKINLNRHDNTHSNDLLTCTQPKQIDITIPLTKHILNCRHS